MTGASVGYNIQQRIRGITTHHDTLYFYLTSGHYSTDLIKGHPAERIVRFNNDISNTDYSSVNRFERSEKH